MKRKTFAIIFFLLGGYFSPAGGQTKGFEIEVAGGSGISEHLGLLNTKKQALYTDTMGTPVNSDDRSLNQALCLSLGLSYKITR